MKRRVFRRVFIIYIAVLVISVTLINGYLTSVIRTNYINDLKNNLFVQASIIADTFKLKAETDIDAFCRRLNEKTGARITVIDTEGRVLGDSDADALRMENHADRPEIQQALVSPAGSAVRFSKTLKYDLLYVARKIGDAGEHSGFIRIAVPLSEINEAINSLRLKINLSVVIVFLLFGFILIWQTERIRKFVIQISDHVGSLTHGLFGKKLYIENAGEFTELARNLNDMASELEDSMRTIDEEKRRLNVILKSIPDALLLIDIHGTIKLSNNAAAELFAPHKLDGRPFIDIVRSPRFLSLFDTVKKSLKEGAAEIVLDVPEEKNFFVRVSPLFYHEGELAGVVAIFHDMTQMKKLEQMRKDFVANVSHEIKTPVTAIQGFAETLLDGALYDSENAEKFLSTIKSHSMRLNRLVDDLLTISRIELGVIAIHKTDVHVLDIIDNVVNIELVRAAEKNLTIKKKIVAGELIVRSDRDRVEQMLLNLLDNAVKFTEKGEIEIGAMPEDGRNCLFVRDTGPGVPEKYIPRLGERFFRVDPSRSRELGGTGLGLAIVKHIVKAHGWEMKIESKEGRGTTVKIYYS